MSGHTAVARRPQRSNRWRKPQTKSPQHQSPKRFFSSFAFGVSVSTTQKIPQVPLEPASKWNCQKIVSCSCNYPHERWHTRRPAACHWHASLPPVWPLAQRLPWRLSLPASSRQRLRGCPLKHPEPPSRPAKQHHPPSGWYIGNLLAGIYAKTTTPTEKMHIYINIMNIKSRLRRGLASCSPCPPRSRSASLLRLSPLAENDSVLLVGWYRNERKCTMHRYLQICKHRSIHIYSRIYAFSWKKEDDTYTNQHVCLFIDLYVLLDWYVK